MKFILFLLMTYLVYRFLSRFFTSPTQQTSSHWKTFYTNMHQAPKEKDISNQARVIDSTSLKEK
ncbi:MULTISPECIES: hypothetical protein [Leptospira]|uniref:Uncharacterized protein n=2 Tax=Leptospira kirschneri TaxID=29507 RepID=A0A1T1DUJ0_9LEPT|nr:MULTISPECIES: hypothetical protein [Leptospira]EMO77252.1 hypothetical protein LEP1GSC127_3689 [Leptospira kirschneri str. 200801925]EJO69755.1 hypothetical protein LEP1GSC044_2738 [Leptospira kirschneri serovar Grippotyphosa str. RM52]EKO53117.1 hypothetical protein LEP1GSC131_0582 [Leptospira kirschneri str. 200802841]EKQ82717.1 hypothetical protein LEP1GSC064_2140 [Leptospira kirschneri serovar Grippotyphosa str. Moskva]EKR07313.1 hypothetical protein LEP1GSC122_2768 [Leptospira kirschne